ncbi:MAG: cyanophycin synthetase [Candidatus Eisenbacteria bacterium]|uniref:Cyanophycin synthetase n=1 Tax=Eiseniibacteriota bacterium TaxID=2212470 RepID=A0A849SJ73_UNCEI|nr:cyanophycin synthetase [Candidatus Eisenbacteria bacterium]
MKLLETSVYLGPSIHALFPVIRFTLDLEELEQWPTLKLGRGFIDGLLAALPGLHEHGCSYETPGGFVRRMTEDEGTWLGHVLEHCAIEIQNLAGAHVTFGKTRSADGPGRYHVVYQYEEAEVGLEAGKLALALLRSLLPAPLKPKEPAEFEFATARDDFIRFSQRRALGPSTASLVRAAEERDIPWLRLNHHSLIQFGHGRYQRRIQATITSETRHIAVEIASDKEETNRILSDLGLPVPRQELVYSEEECAKSAQKIGFPVAVKPYNGNHGRGVSLNLADGPHVREAFHKAREHSRGVVVESFIQGDDHRMLVVDGQLIAVAKRIPGHVVGDGTHTVAQLVEIVNRDPRRGIGHEKILTRLELDHQAERCLRDLGYTPDSVPPAGERVALRLTGNLSTGGTALDVTDVVHPDNAEMAIRAVKAIGLDVGGVDFITRDISLSYKEDGGAICELNAAPGFRMHVAPSEGTPRDVAGPVMDMLFPPGTPVRIPIATITGTNGKTTTARMLAHVFKLAGHVVGLTTTDGVYIDGQLTVKGDMTGPVAARMVLRDPAVDVAVLESARGGILRRGLGYRKCNVGAVLNISADHLGLKGVDTLEQLAEVKRIVVEVAQDTAVLNADDPYCLRMADHTRAKHLCYVTMSIDHALVREHIRAGGRAVVLEPGAGGNMIAIYDHHAHIPLLWAHLVPATLEGRALHNVQNAMFAAALAFSMGVKLEGIRQGLRTFDTTFFQAPGRTNVYDQHPFRVILDYGHNPAAVSAMCETVDRLDVKGRRIVVLAAPGDRRDEDIVAIARTAARHFDHYICRRDDALRGRASDEVPRMLRAALLEAGVPAEQVEVVEKESPAVERALRLARPGDLVLLFGDALQRTWDQVVAFDPQDAEHPRPAGHAPVRVALPPAPDLGREMGGAIIRDERGVRLAAREPEVAD